MMFGWIPGVPEECEPVCDLPVGRPAETPAVPGKKPLEESAWLNGFGKPMEY